MINRILMLLGAAAVLGCSSVAHQTTTPDGPPNRYAFRWADTSVTDAPTTYENVVNLLAGPQPFLALYREDITHDAVVEFFSEVAGSQEIALTILYHADRVNISPALVFSMAWVESRFETDAVNRNATSIDRGLFQLNSLTFRNLTEEDFFHPDVNTYHGLEYLQWCLEHTATEREAVAVYNAGLTRVRAGRTPASTLRYVDRVYEFRGRLEERFYRRMLNEFPSQRT